MEAGAKGDIHMVRELELPITHAFSPPAARRERQETEVHHQEPMSQSVLSVQ